MVSALVYVFLIGLPCVGAAVAIVASIRSYRLVKNQKPTIERPDQAPNPMLVFSIFPIVLILFGAMLWFLSSGKASDADTSALLESAAIAYGVPSLLSGIGIGIVLSNGVKRTVLDYRLLPRVFGYTMHPVTVAMFGLVISFLTIGHVSPSTVGSQLTADSAFRAAIYISIGGVAAPLSAILSTTYVNAWTPQGFGRAIIRSTVGESVCIIFLILAFYSINI